MNLRPLLGDFTDPQYRLARPARRELHKRVHEKYLRPWHLTSMTVSLVIIYLLVARYFLPLATDLIGQASAGAGWAAPHWASWSGAFGLYIILVWLSSAWAYRFIYIRPIRRAMREQGFDLCIACGYDLRAHDDAGDTRCPECGTARVEPEDTATATATATDDAASATGPNSPRA